MRAPTGRRPRIRARRSGTASASQPTHDVADSKSDPDGNVRALSNVVGAGIEVTIRRFGCGTQTGGGPPYGSTGLIGNIVDGAVHRGPRRINCAGRRGCGFVGGAAHLLFGAVTVGKFVIHGCAPPVVCVIGPE